MTGLCWVWEGERDSDTVFTKAWLMDWPHHVSAVTAHRVSCLFSFGFLACNFSPFAKNAKLNMCNHCCIAIIEQGTLNRRQDFCSYIRDTPQINIPCFLNSS